MSKAIDANMTPATSLRPDSADPDRESPVILSEVSDVDRYERLLRYVWIYDEQRLMPLFVNRALVLNGYVTVTIYPPDEKYAEELLIAEATADRRNRGLWSQCDQSPGSTDPPPPVATTPPIITNCGNFPSQGAAQLYLNDTPAAARFLDPNGNGIACEDYFLLPTPTTMPAPPGPEYEWPQYDVDCPDISWSYAQWILAQDRSDPHRLDLDYDGEACEWN